MNTFNNPDLEVICSEILGFRMRRLQQETYLHSLVAAEAGAVVRMFDKYEQALMIACYSRLPDSTIAALKATPIFHPGDESDLGRPANLCHALAAHLRRHLSGEPDKSFPAPATEAEAQVADALIDKVRALTLRESLALHVLLETVLRNHERGHAAHSGLGIPPKLSPVRYQGMKTGRRAKISTAVKEQYIRLLTYEEFETLKERCVTPRTGTSGRFTFVRERGRDWYVRMQDVGAFGSVAELVEILALMEHPPAPPKM